MLGLHHPIDHLATMHGAISDDKALVLCRFEVLLGGHRFIADFQGALAVPEATGGLDDVLARLRGTVSISGLRTIHPHAIVQYFIHSCTSLPDVDCQYGDRN